MEIIRIKGCVEIYNKEGSFYEISGSPKYLQSILSNTDTPGILFIGRNLEISKLYDFILDCRSHLSKLPLKTRKLLTDAEIERIENDLAENSEYFFDGNRFVDTLGKSYKKHPDLEQALLDYIDEENEKIGKFNRGIEKERSIIKSANKDAIINQIFF